MRLRNEDSRNREGLDPAWNIPNQQTNKKVNYRISVKVKKQERKKERILKIKSRLELRFTLIVK